MQSKVREMRERQDCNYQLTLALPGEIRSMVLQILLGLLLYYFLVYFQNIFNEAFCVYCDELSEFGVYRLSSIRSIASDQYQICTNLILASMAVSAICYDLALFLNFEAKILRLPASRIEISRPKCFQF
ncbi:MAG: hypothetical protein EZS28_005781 [Streblomastix strix]|uniref:Uncharacterized protein n=1 Tax=Streblomastix strix TaxID=222440 RepID=A0A5J4WWS0_9EUKA|nr:MAG: hypothetical protein EZS28_005781 [Streblomastix strix]